MKKIIYLASVLCIVMILFSCSKDEVIIIETEEQITAPVILPLTMKVDSTDEDIYIPFDTEANEESITWSSSDPLIATVNEQGMITVLNEGTITITAKSGIHESQMHLITTLDQYAGFIRIRTKAEFLMTFSNPDNFNDPNKKFVLDTDIDFGGDNIEPIGGWDLSTDEIPIDPSTQFRATIDGRGYALKNFNITNPQKTKVDNFYFGVSLIPFVYDGVVRNLNIINANFSGSGFTGSIAGKILHGTIENCFVQGTITATTGDNSIPSGGIAGIIGTEAIIRNVILDVKVNGGFIYSGFNFGYGTNCSAISETLDDEDRRRPIRNTAITTNKGNEEEDAALRDFENSARIENEFLGMIDAYTLTQDVKYSIWTITEGHMPFLIRKDGMIPSWAKIMETVNED